MPRTAKANSQTSAGAVVCAMPAAAPLQSRPVRRRSGASIARGRSPLSPAMQGDGRTVSQLLPEWEAEYRRSPKANEKEIDWFVSIARDRILPHLGQLPVTEVSENRLNELLAHYSQSAELYIYTFFVVRSLFTFAYKKGLCPSNPVPTVYCKKTFYGLASSS